MPGNPLIYILCDRELFVGDVFTYIHVSTSGTVAYDNVSSLVENTLFKFSFENSIYSLWCKRQRAVFQADYQPETCICRP